MSRLAKLNFWQSVERIEALVSGRDSLRGKAYSTYTSQTHNSRSKYKQPWFLRPLAQPRQSQLFYSVKDVQPMTNLGVTQISCQAEVVRACSSAFHNK